MRTDSWAVIFQRADMSDHDQTLYREHALGQAAPRGVAAALWAVGGSEAPTGCLEKSLVGLEKCFAGEVRWFSKTENSVETAEKYFSKWINAFSKSAIVFAGIENWFSKPSSEFTCKEKPMDQAEN